LFVLWDLNGGHGLNVEQVLHVVHPAKEVLHKEYGQNRTEQKAVWYLNDFVISVSSPKVLKK